MNSDLVNTLLGDQEALKPGDGSLKRRISTFAASCCVIPKSAACKWYGSCASARGGAGNWEQMLTISCRTTCRPVQKVAPSKKTQFKKSTLKDQLTRIRMSLQPVDVNVACVTTS